MRYLPVLVAGLLSGMIPNAQTLIPGQSVAGGGGKLITYTLAVGDTTVNFTGKPTPALATNGSIPAPTLRFTEGDTARMLVINRTGGTVSFHWHGLLLPNEYDGVPLLNTSLIEPGMTHEFIFPIIQHGTYWYHSHTEFQEQKGLYGAIVIQPRQPYPEREKVVVLSDFTTQAPWEVLRQLKKHTDWYAIQRDATQSYGKALLRGHLDDQLWLEWQRMPAMDLADIYYDAFLANGQLTDSMSEARPGEKVRLRVINGSASSHFWLHYAGGPMTIVAADGINVEPVEVDKMLIATAETYDLEVVLPRDGRFEFRATSWDRYKHTSLWIGTGARVPAADLPPVNYYGLVEEMRAMMQMMPGMTMSSAPAQRPDTKLYAPGEAPTYEQIESQAMADMGMDMPMNEHEGHDMPMPAETPPAQDTTEAPMPGHQMPATAPRPGHDSVQQQAEGNVYHADEMDGQTMDMTSTPGGHGDGRKGIMLTGYDQLKAAYPDDTFFDYSMLRATQPTALAEDAPVRVIHLYLSGNMLRYIWMINNKPLSAADKIMINEGEVVRFVFHNTTMMSHPMHLHGHFFRVINGQDQYAPLKHTVNVAPMETTIIEFAATEDRDWFFHCHLLYHMMSGMARIIGYTGSEVPLSTRRDYDKFAMDDTKWYPAANLSVLNNGYWADVSVFNIYNEFSLEGDGNYDGNFEAEGKYMRYIGPKQFLAPYLGAEFNSAADRHFSDVVTPTRSRALALLGVRYFLPMMVWADLRVDHHGRFQLELEREDIPLTQRWRAAAGVEYNFADQEWEYTIGTSFILGQYWGIAGNYDSEYGWGIGLRLMY